MTVAKEDSMTPMGLEVPPAAPLERATPKKNMLQNVLEQLSDEDIEPSYPSQMYFNAPKKVPVKDQTRLSLVQKPIQMKQKLHFVQPR